MQRYNSKKASSQYTPFLDLDTHSKTRKRPRVAAASTRSLRPLVLQLVKWIIPALCIGTVLFFYVFELHIEVQRYRRGWIETHVDTLKPLAPASICPLPVSQSQSQEQSVTPLQHGLPQLHAGLSLQRGDDCYNFANLIRPQHNNRTSQTIYHTYWRSDLRPLGSRQLVFLQSLMSTQASDVSHFILWTNNVAGLNSGILPLDMSENPHFEIRQVDLTALSQSTPLEGSPLLDMATDSKAWLDGDLVRLLLLYHYGGVWIDFDFLLLRSFDPLLDQEWLIQWDCYDKPYAPLNGAVMHFFKQSYDVCQMLYAMTIEPVPKRGTTDWGSLLYQKVWRRLVAEGHQPFNILPWCFMDGRSCRLDNRLPDPFAKDPAYHVTRWKALDKKLDAVFAIHLHNQWNKAFPKNGWIQRLVLPRFLQAH